MTNPMSDGDPALNPVALENAIQEISRRMHAQDLARTLHKELSALQSLNSNVREMWRAERGFGG